MMNSAVLARGFLKWVALLALIGIGLLYLNGAAFSAWMSGGPPNPHPVGWGRRAIGQLCFSLSAFVAASGGFLFIGKLPSLSKAGLSLLIAAVALAAAPYVGRAVVAASCVDNGGQWRNLTLECEQ
jgi:hypothetical protein